MPDFADDLAHRLHAARREDHRVPLIRPGSLGEAYAVQQALDALDGSPIVGLKIGATLEGALTTLALDAPFHGRLRADHHHHDHATLALPRAHPVNVETEFVVGFDADLRLEPHAHDVRKMPPQLVQRVAESVAYVAPGFEFVGSRFDMTQPGNGTALVADAAANVATVLGTPRDGAHREHDPAAVQPMLAINDQAVASGSGADSLAGHPFAMTAWLLGQPELSERGIKAGEFVFCGTCTGALPVSAGDRLFADFGALGSVSVTLA